jgi:hypothetical protein
MAPTVPIVDRNAMSMSANARFRQLQSLLGRETVPNKRIGAMGNAVVPALLALEQLGFEVIIQNSSVGQTIIAVRGEEEYFADDPVTVLGLIKLIEVRTWQWSVNDSELEKTMQKYRLGA